MYYGYDSCGYTSPVAIEPAYCYPVAGAGFHNSFALIVVLFILLIIIGASCFGRC
ncbi:putative membrane protein [Bacillus methanolicus MGA3]|uniref:Putative membrane protein n=1 Tax=Bacillus methanolicus (strain MGA3 / ATCC 53907) TaxID=796606 RepID=A0A068LRM2_BACMM|nr:putative membrane protein [Bacillus methanolicus MGA3]